MVRLWQCNDVSVSATDCDVTLIATLGESRSVAVTLLALTYTCSLLAVGNEDGCVSVWDMEVSKMSVCLSVCLSITSHHNAGWVIIEVLQTTKEGDTTSMDQMGTGSLYCRI